jgi:hypothetical protein
MGRGLMTHHPLRVSRLFFNNLEEVKVAIAGAVRCRALWLWL